ncbi:MAG: hypothetical protein BJ554DRAFT_1403, partial [Olpidium bornovanus]
NEKHTHKHTNTHTLSFRPCPPGPRILLLAPGLGRPLLQCAGLPVAHFFPSLPPYLLRLRLRFFVGLVGFSHARRALFVPTRRGRGGGGGGGGRGGKEGAVGRSRTYLIHRHRERQVQGRVRVGVDASPVSRFVGRSASDRVLSTSEVRTPARHDRR